MRELRVPDGRPARMAVDVELYRLMKLCSRRGHETPPVATHPPPPPAFARGFQRGMRGPTGYQPDY